MKKCLFTYLIKVRGAYDEWEKTFIAETPAKARYQLYLEFSDIWNISFREFLDRVISCRTLCRFSPANLFPENGLQFESFEGMKTSRSLPDIYLGQRISFNGRQGYIVGSNSSGNLNVCFDGEHWRSNVHPHDGVVYL